VNVRSLPQGVQLAIEAAQNKKAAGITVLELSNVGAFTSYFVICTGFSTPQVQAICREVEERLYKQLGRSPEHREGYASSQWALLDFGSFIVHVFSEQARRYYDLERLWRSAPKLEIPDEPCVAESGSSARNIAVGGTSLPGEAFSK
jgi:ribosome-associated protein